MNRYSAHRLILAVAGAFGICGVAMQTSFLALAASPCSKFKTQIDLSQCSHAEASKADIDLEFALERARQSISRGGKNKSAESEAKALAEAIDAWRKFQKVFCYDVVGANYKGGSMQGMAISVCMDQNAKALTKQLEELAP